MAMAFARAIEEWQPVEARLVRLHDCFWLRLWRRSQIGPLPHIGLHPGPDCFDRRPLKFLSDGARPDHPGIGRGDLKMRLEKPSGDWDGRASWFGTEQSKPGNWA